MAGEPVAGNGVRQARQARRCRRSSRTHVLKVAHRKAIAADIDEAGRRRGDNERDPRPGRSGRESRYRRTGTVSDAAASARWMAEAARPVGREMRGAATSARYRLRAAVGAGGSKRPGRGFAGRGRPAAASKAVSPKAATSTSAISGCVQPVPHAASRSGERQSEMTACRLPAVSDPESARRRQTASGTIRIVAMPRSARQDVGREGMMQRSVPPPISQGTSDAANPA